MHLSCEDGWEEESNQRRAIRPLCGGPCSEPAASLGGCCSPEALGPILLAGDGGSSTARAGCAAGGFAGGVESGETHAGVLVLACLAARSVCSALWERRAGSPAGLRSHGGLHGAVAGCRVAPTPGFRWKSPAVSSGPRATLGPVCLGAAGRGRRQLECQPCLCLHRCAGSVARQRIPRR